MDSYDAHSPFTIRLELLKLAQSIESARLFADRNRIEQDWHATKEDCDRTGSPAPPFPVVPAVTYEDVVRVAEELNKFVSNKVW
jgi:hypothetical protein